jgi:hypothetical protein
MAAIDAPASHQGIVRPPTKKSSSDREARRASQSPIASVAVF